MNTKQVFLIALLGAGVGGAATQVAHVGYAEAQSAPGQMRECSALRLGSLVTATDAVQRPVQVPQGWTPIGGTSADDAAGVVICR